MAISREEIHVKIVGIDGVTQGYDRISDAQKRTQKESSNTDKSLNKGAGAFNGLTGALMGAHAAVGLLTTGMMAAQKAMNALRAPVGLAVSFEEGFAKITTLLDGPTASFGKLRGELLNLANSVPQTAEDIALAAYQAISAGIPHDQVAEFLATASKAAVGAGATMTEAVEALTTSVNGFKAENMDAARAANILFATQKQGVTTVRELNQNLGKATGLSQFGVRMDEVTAAVAQLTKLGTPTSEAFTQIVAVVKTLAAETGPASKKFKELGVEFGIGALQSKGLSGVLADLQEKTGGSAQVLGGLTRRMEATNGFLKLLGPNFQDFNTILDGNRASTDYVGDAFSKLNDTTQGATNSFNALKEGVLRELGDRLLPIVNEMLQRMTVFLQQNGDKFVDTFASGLEALFKFGMWIVENGDKILIFLAAAFAPKAALTLASAITTLIARFQALSTAAGAAGVSTLSALGKGLMAPGPLGALAGIGLIVGKMIGDAIVDGQIKQLEARANEMADQVEKNGKVIEDRLNRSVGKTQAQVTKMYEDVSTGGRFGAGAELNLGLLAENFDPQTVKAQLDQLNTPAEEFKKIQEQITEEMKQGKRVVEDERDLQIQAFEILNERLAVEIEAREAAFAGYEERRLAAMGEADQLRDRLAYHEAFVKAGIAETYHAEQIERINRQIAAAEAAIAAATNDRKNAEMAILRIKKIVAGLDPEAETKKQAAFVKKPTTPKGRGGKSQRQKDLEELQKIENQAAANISALNRRIENARRDLLKVESDILRDREFMIKDSQGREIKATEEHLQKLGALDRLTIKALTAQGVRVADEGDAQLEKLKDRHRKQIDQIIRQTKLIEKVEKIEKQSSTADIDALSLTNVRRQRAEGTSPLLQRADVSALDESEVGVELVRHARAEAAELRREMSDLRISGSTMSDLDAIAFRLVDAHKNGAGLAQALANAGIPQQVIESYEKLLTAQGAELELAKAKADAERKARRERALEESRIRTQAIDRERLGAGATGLTRQASETANLRAKQTSELKELQDREIEMGVEFNSERMALEAAHRQETVMLTADHNNEITELQNQLNTRLIGADGFFHSAKIDALRAHHEQELELYRTHGIEIGELVKQQSTEMSIAQVQQFSNTTGAYADGAAATVSNINGIMGAFSDLANARMRTAQTELKAGKITRAEYQKAQKQAGELQAKQIIAQGVYHGFMGVSEQAKAVSAFAEGFKNPVMFAAAAAHQAAAVMHFVRASMAGEMASHARRGTSGGAGGGGGGGAGGGMSGVASQGSGYMERAELTEQQRENAGVRFGDIILSDLPHLLSADGASELGRHIAGAVVEEINGNAYVAGGYRLSRRSQRGV